MEKIAFLGQIVSKKGTKVDPAKLESIWNWATPKNATEIRTFLGLAGYYRRFIHNFSRLPLSTLTKKGMKFECTDKCEETFDELKERLMSAPVLTILKSTGQFLVYIDASKNGLGAVLMQNDKAIAYNSNQLK